VHAVTVLSKNRFSVFVPVEVGSAGHYFFVAPEAVPALKRYFIHCVFFSGVLNLARYQ
jgi:hypothetical protein